jgi:polyisoprenoid-binding protein YceI
MTDSVDSAISDRDKHLRSADFFSSKEFPEMTFKSTSFANKADNTFDVTGELNFMGKAKTITVPVTFTGKGPGMRGGEVAGFETRFTIKRSEFGMDKMLNNLSDDVSLIIAFEGSR